MGQNRGPALLLGVLLLVAAAMLLVPNAGYAQQAGISGTVRDSQGAALPGVTVEVTSPALIEKVRSTTTDNNGRYQITALPVGTYSVSFSLASFGKVVRDNVVLSSDFTAPVNADMKPGEIKETVNVFAETPAVDVQNARQRQVFSREELTELPITRNINSLVQLVPGISIGAASTGNSTPRICSGGQADGAAVGGTFSGSGALSGCNPLIQSFNAHSSINDPDSLNQGRMQVDGLSIQSGIQSALDPNRSAYVADISNAQEVTFTLSGSLGESETGGTTINIVPRTGGNRYAGNVFTAYSDGAFYDRNDGTRPSTFSNRLVSEYDANASYGGPILRDRLWFYGTVRRQLRESLLTAGFRNLNEGVFGANYQFDPNAQLNQTDLYQNASMRLTVQATQKNKFNVFWDEQYTCQNPCDGAGPAISPEATSSALSWPLHVAQLSWTNPVTNKILLEAGMSHYGQHNDFSRHRYETSYPSIPRIAETGANTLVSPTATVTTAITSGSINSANQDNVDNIQSRASASYVTGSHNLKLGYQGQYLSRVQRPAFNDMRLLYNYATPALPGVCVTAACVTAANAGSNPAQFIPATNAAGVTGIQNGCYSNPAPLTTNIPSVPAATGPAAPRPWCGAINLPGNAGGLNDPTNSRFLPVPASVTQYIPTTTDENAWYASLFVQDQWTLNRLTFSGALRYDNAQSSYGESCVGPDVWKQDQYCLNNPDNPLNGGGTGKGVYFQDITPRWGVTWDVFGTGKTALKYSQGKYLDGVQAGGVYTALNPASGTRTVNSYNRTWIDANGDRTVNCDLVVPSAVPPATGIPANGECGAPAQGQAANSRRFGRSPSQLDAETGLAVGLTTVTCGQDEPSMSPLIRTYCNNYFAAGGKNPLSGWGRRRYEWQISLGVQHELLPRLSAEVTYNRRNIGNQSITDELGEGCDLYASSDTPVNPDQCMADLLNFKSTYYDFYSVRAPEDSRLPGGGGYVIPGFSTAKQLGVNASGAPTYVAPPVGSVNAVTLQSRRKDYWSGVDTNFVLRAKGGLRLSGGTSTGRRNDDTCDLLINDPPAVELFEGTDRNCNRERPFQTNVRGTATYTIPWIDVLLSSTFSYRPGTQLDAAYTTDLTALEWLPGSGLQVENGQPRALALQGNTQGTITTPLMSNQTFGEGIRIVDIRLAKNIRFAGKRINIGADVFNVFNSDAALDYCSTFPNPSRNIQGCGSAAQGTLRVYNEVISTTTPRYARFQVQFDF